VTSTRTLAMHVLGLALVTASATAAAQAPYYNPDNAASRTGKTTDYELYRTIGCPGQGILGSPCRAPSPPAPLDSDRDGILDNLDRCPDTPLGAKVDPQGCELDSDRDGVLDRLDQCPGTPLGSRVDALGCELDSDGDGVVDRLDQCPGTSPGVKVNSMGCEPDTDRDGVVDRLDQCPGTPAGTRVDPLGCELDSDKDGVVDRLDRCPNTPVGHKVNGEGCDMDTDGDGIPDRTPDLCPDTPRGDRVNAQGCSLPGTLVLNGVRFDNDQATLKSGSTAILDEAVAIMKRYPGFAVEIAGHTDSVGNDQYNQELSQRRAVTVMEYFVQQGVTADRMTARGYGETEPLADNATPEGRAENRRVELRAKN